MTRRLVRKVSETEAPPPHYVMYIYTLIHFSEMYIRFNLRPFCLQLIAFVKGA